MSDTDVRNSTMDQIMVHSIKLLTPQKLEKSEIMETTRSMIVMCEQVIHMHQQIYAAVMEGRAECNVCGDTGPSHPFGSIRNFIFNFQSRSLENPAYKADQFYTIASDLEVASNIEEDVEPGRWGCVCCFTPCTR